MPIVVGSSDEILEVSRKIGDVPSWMSLWEERGFIWWGPLYERIHPRPKCKLCGDGGFAVKYSKTVPCPNGCIREN
jgi:hypothetical protein